jgi:hypothetical protein
MLSEGHSGADGKIILKRILKKYGVRRGFDLPDLRQEQVAGFFFNGTDTSGPQSEGEFLE